VEKQIDDLKKINKLLARKVSIFLLFQIRNIYSDHCFLNDKLWLF